ncbi:MAG: hypothetical protein KatS3mg008_1356 [Acidimicrobiales bacterium]|nr:MAG: hypothetical protein KatS3mg008_1356 [Acidimicrobiales bacterium]
MQVGAALAAVEAGLVPDILAGTSVGALNAAFLAAGFDRERVAELIRIWTSLADCDAFRSPWWKTVLNLLKHRDRLLADEPLRRVIEMIPYDRIEDAAIPLTIVATALEDGSEVRFSSGRIEPVLLASCAVPGMFPPVQIDGRWFVDGAVTANTPVSAAIEAGAQGCVVFDLWSPIACSAKGRDLFHLVQQSIQIMGRQRTLFELSCPLANVQIHHVSFVCDKPIPLDDLSHTAELLRMGYEIGRSIRSARRRASTVSTISAMASSCRSTAVTSNPASSSRLHISPTGRASARHAMRAARLRSSGSRRSFSTHTSATPTRPRAHHPRQFTCGRRLVREGTECAFAHDCVQRVV